MSDSNYRRRHALFLALGVSPLTIPQWSTAQEDKPMLEEVVVTARRREESLQDAPVAITSFSGSDLENSGAGVISEISQTAPSVTLEPSRGTNSTLTAFIRGIGQQDPLAGFEQGVALYLDDVYMARPQGALLDVYDVERIEVLRGPQGTLYGRNAVGGAIKYVTRRLPESFEASFKQTIGSYQQLDSVASIGGPVNDQVRLGLTGALLKRDGFGTNLTTGDENYNKDIFAFRLSAEFEPSDTVLVRAAYDTTKDGSAPVAGFRPFPEAVSGGGVLSNVRDTRAGAAQSESTRSINGNNEVNAEGFSVSINWDVNESLTLRSITAHREDDTETVIDFDSTASQDFDGAAIYENEQTSQEFQLLYNTDSMSLVTGLYFLDASAANYFDLVLTSSSTVYTSGVVETNSWSWFGDLTYDLTEKLSVALGLRYTEDERAADIFAAGYAGIGSSPLSNPSAIPAGITSDYENSRTFSDLSPRINFDYLVNDDVTAYLSYSQGWKVGSFDPRGRNIVTPDTANGFEPETLDSYEFGLKTQWWEGRAITNIALFTSNYTDMQIPGSIAYDSNGDGVRNDFQGTVTNAGAASIDGIEVEATFALTQALTLQVSGNQLNAEIDEWIFNGENIADERAVQNTPETMLNVGANYTLDLIDGELILSGNASYKSEVTQFETPVDVIDQNAATIVNANAVWRSGDEHWMVGLHAKNLTDKDIKTAGYCFGSGGCSSASLGREDNTTVFYAPPRTVALSVKYDFF